MKGMSIAVMKKAPTSSSKNKIQHHVKDNIKPIVQIIILKAFHVIQQLGKRKTVVTP
jgi:hypothetical protein